MTDIPIKIQFVKTLSTAKPSRIVAVKADGDTTFSLYVTDKSGLSFPIKDNTGGLISAIQNTDGNLTITGTTTKTINLDTTIVALISSAIQSGDNISELTNDVGYLTGFTETDPIFLASEASLFVAGDKTKLDGIEAGAEVNNISDTNATDLTDGGSTTLHNHDSRYYTETEVDNLLNDKFDNPTGNNTQYLDGAGTPITFPIIPDVTGFVPYVGATTNVDLGEHQIKAGQVEFDQTPTGTFGVGMVRWNDTDGTTERRLKGNSVTLQDGQEVLKRVVNKTGVDLLESQYKVVRLRSVLEGGAQGQRSAVVLAEANSNLSSKALIGVVTETILNNQEGFITIIGEVREINTTGALQSETWVDGDQLYLSATVAGQLTNIVPISPNYSIPIATVDYAHAVHGKLSVNIGQKIALDTTLSGDNDTSPSGTAVKSYVDTNTIKVFHSNTSPGTDVTGVTSETVLESILIPANTFQVGSWFDYYQRMERVSRTSTASFKLYTNTISSLTLATLVGQYSIAINQGYIPYKRRFSIQSGNTSLGYAYDGSSLQDDVVAGIFRTPLFDPTVDQYLISTVTPTLSANNCQTRELIITGKK